MAGAPHNEWVFKYVLLFNKQKSLIIDMVKLFATSEYVYLVFVDGDSSVSAV